MHFEGKQRNFSCLHLDTFYDTDFNLINLTYASMDSKGTLAQSNSKFIIFTIKFCYILQNLNIVFAPIIPD